jgi:hypothetical protein
MTTFPPAHSFVPHQKPLKTIQYCTLQIHFQVPQRSLNKNKNMNNNTSNNPSSLGSNNNTGEGRTSKVTKPRSGNDMNCNDSREMIGISSRGNGMRNVGKIAQQRVRNNLNVNGGINLFGNFATDPGLGDLYTNLHCMNGTGGITHQSEAQGNGLSNSLTASANVWFENMDNEICNLSMDETPNTDHYRNQQPALKSFQTMNSTQMDDRSNERIPTTPVNEMTGNGTSRFFNDHVIHQSPKGNMGSSQANSGMSGIGPKFSNRSTSSAHTTRERFEQNPNVVIPSGHQSASRNPRVNRGQPKKDPMMFQDENGRWLDQDGDEIIPTAIVIKSIPFDLRQEELESIMAETRMTFPHALNYHFVRDEFKGVAFANFTDVGEAWAAIVTLHGMEVRGRKIVAEAKKLLDPAKREELERKKKEQRGQLRSQHMPYPEGMKVPVPDFKCAPRPLGGLGNSHTQNLQLPNNERPFRQPQTTPVSCPSASKLFFFLFH